MRRDLSEKGGGAVSGCDVPLHEGAQAAFASAAKATAARR